MSFFKNISNIYITDHTVLRDNDKWMVSLPDYKDKSLPIEVRDLSWKYRDKPFLIQVKDEGSFYGGAANCHKCVFYCDSNMSDRHCVSTFFNVPPCIRSAKPDMGKRFIFEKIDSL